MKLSKEEWFAAIRDLKKEKVIKMIKHGFNINTLVDGDQNALHKLQHIDKEKEEQVIGLINLLVKYGINLNQKNISSETPVSIFSLMYKFPKAIECLIENGANTFPEGKIGIVIFHNALVLNQTPILKKLIELGHDINIENEEGKTYAEASKEMISIFKTGVFKSLMEFEDLLDETQKEIIDKEKLRLLFKKPLKKL